MKTLHKAITALIAALLVSSAIAMPANAATSITQPLKDVQAKLAVNYPSPGFKVDFTWTAPAAADGSEPFYDFYISPSNTDPKATGSVALGEWMNIGTDTSYNSGSTQRLKDGTYYAWVIARFNLGDGNGYTAATSGSAPVSYTWPVTYKTVDRKASTPDLFTTDTNTLRGRWFAYDNQQQATWQLSGPSGVIEVNQTLPARLTDSVGQVFKNLPKGSYRLRVKQVGVASEQTDSQGDYVNLYDYLWSDWTKPVYINAPGTPKNVKLNITRHGAYALNLNIGFKKPSANGGYMPVLYRIKVMERDRVNKKWYANVDTLNYWTLTSPVKIKQYLGDYGYDRYRVKVAACHIGNSNLYKRAQAEDHVTVCGAYSPWSAAAKVPGKPAPAVNR